VTGLPADVVRTLADKEAVREVILRWVRGTDRRDFPLLRSCYHDDAYDDRGPDQGGPDAYVERVSEGLPQWERTMHFIGNQLIEVEGHVAHAESYCVAYHRRAASDGEQAYDMVVGLRYVDRLERRNGEWRIACRVRAWEWSRVDPVGSTWEFGPEATRGRPFPDDAVYR
jgi:ketosteroid isomerase-like protein